MTIAVAVLAHKLENDHYSVVVFKDEAEVLKSMTEPLVIEGLIRRILNLKTAGLTNIEEALEKGSKSWSQFRRRSRLGSVWNHRDRWGHAGERGPSQRPG